MHSRFAFLNVVYLAIGGAVFAGPVALMAQRGVGGQRTIDFSRDVLPILAERCFTCHGPDGARRKGGAKGGTGMRLDTASGSRADLGGHFAVVPGRPEASELLRRIRATDADRMPPPKTGEPLSSEEIATLDHWIRAGGEYAKHWAFVKPVRPALPPVPDASWPIRPLDRFTAAALERDGLRPAPPASRAALIRRVSLDLTGLPPTLAEVARFVADRDVHAYDKLVDGLLASPSYGEHFARHWLDLARYADSAGYADDPKRTIWAYRDWVIRALNANLSFDAFTVQQIAGDLLPNPTDEQLVATAFHRNTMTNSEGGTDDEEFRSVAVVDRVSTTMSVWMGTTMACAQCHDHKFDPFSQKEFFQLYAFFNTSQDSDKKDERPYLRLFTPKQRRERTRLSDERGELRATLGRDSAALATGQAGWLRCFPRDAAWSKLSRLSAGVKDEGRLAASLDVIHAIRVTGKTLPKRLTVRWLPKARRPVAARFVRVTNLVRNAFLSLAEVQVFAGEKNVAIEGTARQISTGFRGPARLANDGNTDGDFSGAKSTTHTNRAENPWWEVDLGSRRRVDRIAIWNRTDSNGQRLKRFRVELLDGDREVVWHEVVAHRPAPSVEVHPGSARTIAVAGSWTTTGASGATRTLILAEPLAMGDAVLEIGPPRRGKNGAAALRCEASGDAAFAAYRSVPAPILAMLAGSDARRAKGQAALRTHYRSIAAELQPTRARLAVVEKNLAGLQPRTTVPILREQPARSRRRTRIQIRGNFLQTGAEVSTGVPVVFHPLAPNEPKDRLALARWLVSPDNPLTARVAVNRYWESLFGIGLVATSEDFGIRGEPPSHPALLDWLATEFMASGWDVKKLLRAIVTSATYRQSSMASAALRERDPGNRRLARGPRRRLSAEMIRDQALAVSGLLSPKMFGPPVRPPRPNLGLRAAFGGSTDWKDSEGVDRYRRGIYTFWQRSLPYPSMAAFDAPSREVCTVRRLPTNTPLQALVTLNDPVYVEAAQALGRRMVSGGESSATRAAFGFRLCLARAPSDAERTRLVAMFDHAHRRYAADPAAAKLMATKPLGPVPKGADVATLAAWTVVANVLLNLDEVLVQR